MNQTSTNDINGETTPVWMVAKNAGVPSWRMLDLLRAKGFEIVLDSNSREAVRKSDLFALLQAA